MIRALWRKLRMRIVADVPPAIMVCEFDCRKDTCELGHFATCARRLAGEEREKARRAE